MNQRQPITAAKRTFHHHAIAGTVIVFVIVLAAAAQAAAGPRVVPPSGKVAGGGYAYWLGVKEQVFFSSPPTGPKQCGTQRGADGPVAFLFAGSGHTTCAEPAGRPIYVSGISNECSTLHGDHSGFGTSPTQLGRCARAGLKGLTGTATVDGTRVGNYRKLIVGTKAVEIHVPKLRRINSAPSRPTGSQPAMAKGCY